MSPDDLKELFAPIGVVQVKRMFGGAGVYFDSLCFAIETGGEAFLKVDAATDPAFAAAGSSPFVYQAKGKSMITSFWRLPSVGYDDPEELRLWALLALEAAQG